MKVLDLFSGIGGFSLGLERAGFETVAFCEIDPFCRKVLKKHWPEVPIYEDINAITYADSGRRQRFSDGRETQSNEYATQEFDSIGERNNIASIIGPVDVVCGGFPCQPFSHAGKRSGQDDDRALWPQMLRVIREAQPTWAIGENVIGLESMGLENCVSDLESNGFAVQVFDIPACGVGAVHRRHRLWIVGNSNRSGKPNGSIDAKVSRQLGATFVAHSECDERRRNGQGRRQVWGNTKSAGNGKEGIVADASSKGLQGLRGTVRSKQEYALNSQFDGWPTEPPVCRADDGIPNRVERLRSLGNAVVPQIPEILGRAILEKITG